MVRLEVVKKIFFPIMPWDTLAEIVAAMVVQPSTCMGGSILDAGPKQRFYKQCDEGKGTSIVNSTCAQ